MIFSFQDEDNKYLKENNLYNTDESINNNKLQSQLDDIETIITTYSSSKKLYIKLIHVDEDILSAFL